MSNVEYKPAEKVFIRLVRPDSSASWGFRLQGGIDFSTPLSIQSINPGSVSERCGLKPGDAILSINNATSDAMTHDEAKAEIMRSGNEIVMLVERGAVTIWKPKVTPLNDLRPQELNTITSATGEDFQPVQKTSLAINKPPDEPCRIGSTHNRAAQPFGQPKVAVPNVVHAQYNSPMGLYSANNIADSYSQQTAGIQSQMQSLDVNDTQGDGEGSTSEQLPEQQLLATGEELSRGSSLTPSPTNSDDAHSTTSSSSAPGKTTAPLKAPSAKQPTQSAVFEDHQGDTPEYKGYTNPSLQSRTFKHLQEQLAAETEENNNTPGFHSVAAPIARPPSDKPQQPSMRCGGCDMLATGVIVKANGVPYHVACFKCTSCSMNLKQKGFFVVEGNLYCETHAKRQAKPPGPDMVAVPMYR
ncbi:hypothetical protein BsWGS_05985 [Bradybaena similaris]